MKKEIGIVKSIYRYPVKSMACEKLSSASIDLHGVEGDRRFAFRRMNDMGGFPFLTAGKLREMVLYQPFNANEESDSSAPTHIRTPDGREFELDSEDLRKELSAAHKSEVEIMKLKHGIFDDAPLSLITTATIKTLEKETNLELDVRRFRPNILVETDDSDSFPEDKWIGKIIAFGDEDDAAAMSVAVKDIRCAMINFDPDDATSNPEILKTVARVNEVCAGIYGSTFKSGTVSTGQKVYLIEV